MSARPPSYALRIVDVVAQTFAVPVAEILGAGQTKRVCDARYAAIYLCRRTLKSPPHRRLAGWFGKNQASIGYALGQIEKRRARPDFVKRLRASQDALSSASETSFQTKETAHVR